MNFEDEIAYLIDLKAEGGDWDYKSVWHEKRNDLLHDIICMANNLENRDGYIIIGVDDNGKICGGLESDKNRKNQQGLIDFLKDKKFAGDIRPVVYVRTLEVDGKDIDVIIIKNSKCTPYYLNDSFQDVRIGCIYTRIGDTNTPKNRTADIDKIEALWRKRFGINLDPLQKVIFLLENPFEWCPVGTDGKHSNANYLDQYYHHQFPEFTIVCEECYEGYPSGEIDRIDKDFYWMKQLPGDLHNCYLYTVKIRYNTSVLYSTKAIFADNFRFERVLWDHEFLFENNEYCYVEQDSIKFKLDNWLCNRQEIPNSNGRVVRSALEPFIFNSEYYDNNPYNVVPVFKNHEEHLLFKSFVVSHRDEFLNEVGMFSREASKTGGLAWNPNYIEYLCNSGKTLVDWLNKWRIGRK